jgi:hypothetical protein
MALTLAQASKYVPGGLFRTVTNVTLDASYPTGGYLVTPANLGFTVLRSLLAINITSLSGGAYEFSWIPTLNADGVTIASALLAATVGSTGVQVANGVSLATVTLQVVAEGS